MACRGEKLLLTGVLVLLCIGAAHGATLVPQWDESIPGISGLALAEDGSRVIVGTNTGQVFVYDGNGTVCWEKRVPGTVQAGILHNGSAYLVASQEDREKNKGALRLFDGDGEEEWFRNSGWITSMGFCQGTDRIVTGDRAGNVVMLDGGGFEVSESNDLPKTYIIADLALSADGKYFAYVLEEPNPQVRFVTVSSGSRKSFGKDFTYTGTYGYLEPIRQIELSGDGAYVATAGGEGSHGVLNFYARNGTRLWSKDISRINDLTVDGTGGCVFTAEGDGTISCYNRSGSLEWVYPSGAPAGSLSYARGGNLLAAGNDNGDLLLFNRSGGLNLGGNARPLPHRGCFQGGVLLRWKRPCGGGQRPLSRVFRCGAGPRAGGRDAGSNGDHDPYARTGTRGDEGSGTVRVVSAVMELYLPEVVVRGAPRPCHQGAGTLACRVHAGSYFPLKSLLSTEHSTNHL